MRDSIFLEKDLLLVKAGFSCNLSSLAFKQRHYILAYFAFRQLVEKISIAQSFLVTSSPMIQKGFADSLHYNASLDDIQTIINRDIKHNLIASIEQYFHCWDFLINSLNLFLMDYSEFMNTTAIAIGKLPQIKDISELLFELLSHFNHKYFFRGKKIKLTSLALIESNINHIDQNLLNSFLNLKNTADKGIVPKFNANKLKHAYLPLDYSSIDCSVGDYIDFSQKFLSGTFVSDFNNPFININIADTQEALIIWNNELVSFVNQFFKKAKF